MEKSASLVFLRTKLAGILMCGERRVKYLSSLWLTDTKWHKTRREMEKLNEEWRRAWDLHLKAGEGYSRTWPTCHFSGRLLVISLLIYSNGSNSSVTAGAVPHCPNRTHLQTVPYMLGTTWNIQLALTIIRVKYFCHIHLKFFFQVRGVHVRVHVRMLCMSEAYGGPKTTCGGMDSGCPAWRQVPLSSKPFAVFCLKRRQLKARRKQANTIADKYKLSWLHVSWVFAMCFAYQQNHEQWVDCRVVTSYWFLFPCLHGFCTSKLTSSRIITRQS